MDSISAFDAIGEARTNFWTSTHKGGTEHDALNAIAAAAIAQVEATRELVALLKRLGVSTSTHAFLMDDDRSGPEWPTETEDE